MRGSRPTVGSSRNSTCGLGQQRPGDLQPAALAAAVAPDRPVDDARRDRTRRRRRRSRGPVSAGSTPHSRAWISRLRRPVSGRSTTASWNTTALTARAGIGSVTTSKTGQPGAAAGRHDGRGEHADRGRLAGAVGAEQAEHLARRRRRSRCPSPPRPRPGTSLPGRGPRSWACRAQLRMLLSGTCSPLLRHPRHRRIRGAAAW